MQSTDLESRPFVTRRVVGMVALLALPIAAHAQYSAKQDGDVVRLEDTASQMSVSIIPSVGDIVSAVTVKGQNVVRWPYASIDELRGRPGLNGIPFLGPWANRIDADYYYANGKKYLFNMELGNVRGDHPIHGFLTYTDKWKVVEIKADKKSAWATSRLEFYRQPDWMAQFPFAHTVQITHRLSGGVLEVAAELDNLSDEPMPAVIGFHPYYHLTDSPREAWTISVGARTEWMVAPDKIPTGETQPIEKFFPNPQSAALKDYNLDHEFGDLIRDKDGRATMSVTGIKQKLEIQFGPKWPILVLYSPGPATNPGEPPPSQNANAGGRGNVAGNAGRGGNAGGRGRGPQDPNFICFEPMTAITNALNMEQKGQYKGVQMIPPRQSWKESFWVHPSGF